MPLPTAWPIVLALGVSLLVTGMVTSVEISLLGLLLIVLSSIGWFRNVLPVEAHEYVEAQPDPALPLSFRNAIEYIPVSSMHRKILPVERFHFTTGIRGGIAGGIAMILPATLYSVLKYHSLWYAMNLMAAGGFVSWAGESDQFLAQFHMQGFLAALAIHALTSLLVGLLYGAMLPMFPRLPILTAGFLAPLLWTGLLWSTLGLISPILNQRIDWWWFIPSQIAFGLVCGYVVNLHARVRTAQFRALPFAVRAGIEASEAPEESNNPEGLK
jgi:hypothetical protein